MMILIFAEDYCKARFEEAVYYIFIGLCAVSGRVNRRGVMPRRPAAQMIAALLLCSLGGAPSHADKSWFALKLPGTRCSALQALPTPQRTLGRSLRKAHAPWLLGH